MNRRFSTNDKRSAGKRFTAEDAEIAEKRHLKQGIRKLLGNLSSRCRSPRKQAKINYALFDKKREKTDFSAFSAISAVKTYEE